MSFEGHIKGSWHEVLELRPGHDTININKSNILIGFTSIYFKYCCCFWFPLTYSIDSKNIHTPMHIQYHYLLRRDLKRLTTE